VECTNPDQIVVGVGRRIAELRAERAWTQEEAAQRLNITLRHMKRLEAGHNMTIHTAARVAVAFGVAVGELFVPPKSWEPRLRGRPKRVEYAVPEAAEERAAPAKQNRRARSKRHRAKRR
jgi:transcriptional regulator with XRE-family HTH domain